MEAVHALGIGTVFPVSAEHGRGVAQLLEAVAAELEGPPAGEVVPSSAAAPSGQE